MKMTLAVMCINEHPILVTDPTMFVREIAG